MRSLIKIFLLTTLFTMSSVAYAADDCDGKSCVTISASNDTIVEFLSMVFPETTSQKIFKDGTIYNGLIDSAVSGVNTLTKNALNYFGYKVESTPVDNYLGANVDTFSSHYMQDFALYKSMALIEFVIVLLLNMASVIAIASIVFVVMIRFHKIAYNLRSVEVNSNLIMQIPLYLILVGGLISWDGTLAVIPTFLLTMFYVGALINSCLVVALSASLSELLSSDRTYSPSKLLESPRHIDYIQSKHVQLSDSLAESIVLIDKAVSDLIIVESGGEEPSDALFREKFKGDLGLTINEECISGPYWHMDIAFKQSCQSLREHIKLETAALGSGYNLGWSGLRRAVVDTAKRMNPSETLPNELASAIIQDVVHEGYRKANARKEIICATSEIIENPSEYEREWFCNKFNYSLGYWEGGSHYAESVMNVASGSNQERIAKARDELQRKYHIGSKTNFGEKSTIAFKQAVEAQSEENDLSGYAYSVNSNNIVSSFYGVIKGISAGLDASDNLNSHIEEYTEFVYDAVFAVLPAVTKQANGLASTKSSDEDCLDEACAIDTNDGGLDKQIAIVNGTENNSVGFWAFGSQIKDYILSKIHYISNVGDDAILDDIRRNQGHNQNLYSSIVTGTNTALTLFGGALVLSEATKQLQWSKIMYQNSHLTAREAKAEVHKGYAWFQKITMMFIMVACFMLIITIISLPFYWIMMIMMSIVRLISHIIFIPLHIIQFVFDHSDEEEDEDNVFLPPALTGIAQRCLLEPILITTSFVVAIITTIFAFELSRIMIYGFTDIFINENALFSLAAMFFEIFISLAASMFIFMKSTTFIQYSYQKLSEYVSDGLELQMPDDVARDLKQFVKKFY